MAFTFIGNPLLHIVWRNVVVKNSKTYGCSANNREGTG